MNRVCINKLTSKLIEMQQGGDDRPELMAMRLDTLRQNALNAGYKEGEFECKWVDDKELAELMAPTEEELKEREAVAIKAHLVEIDKDSIRSIREWITKQADAPQIAKDLESQAILERAKLEPITISPVKEDLG